MPPKHPLPHGPRGVPRAFQQPTGRNTTHYIIWFEPGWVAGPEQRAGLTQWLVAVRSLCCQLAHGCCLSGAAGSWRCAAPTPHTWGYAWACGLHGASSGRGRGAVWGAGQGLVVCGVGVAGLCVGRRGRDTGGGAVVPWRCAAPTPHTWGYACVCGLHGASSGRGRGAVWGAGQGLVVCGEGMAGLCVGRKGGGAVVPWRCAAPTLHA